MNDDPSLPPPDDDLDQMLIFGDPATRRAFLKQVAGTGAALAVGPSLLLIDEAAAADPTGAAKGETVEVRLVINGRETKLPLDPRVTLLDALRERLTMTGTKKGCDHGQCGACTVLVNGRR
ncbi:MAG: 2Fe-2S iron-sulfur cluster-binding protein, partial [Chthoniobacteraceae bacterium]